MQDVFRELSNKESDWITVSDRNTTGIILQSFGDDDKKRILIALTEKPRVISEILKICNIPQTSGYRKINSLIGNGMIIPVGSVTTFDGKNITTYISAFENMRIKIVKDKIIVKVILNKIARGLPQSSNEDKGSLAKCK